MRVLALKVSRKNKREVVMIPKMIRNLVSVEVIRPQVQSLHILEVETEIDKIGKEKTKEVISHNQEKVLASSTIISNLMKRSRILKNHREQSIKIRTEMDANERNLFLNLIIDC